MRQLILKLFVTHVLNSLEETKKRVERSLADDFDTPKAVAALEELIRRTNVELAQKAKSEVVICTRIII